MRATYGRDMTTREHLYAVLALLADVLDGIPADPPETADAPTPCTDYSIADLRRHVVGWLTAFTDGYAGEERCHAGDCFYWPKGHTVRVENDAEVILFSPHRAHAAVIDHMKAKLGAMA